MQRGSKKLIIWLKELNDINNKVSKNSSIEKSSKLFFHRRRLELLIETSKMA